MEGEQGEELPRPCSQGQGVQGEEADEVLTRAEKGPSTWISNTSAGRDISRLPSANEETGYAHGVFAKITKQAVIFLLLGGERGRKRQVRLFPAGGENGATLRFPTIVANPGQ